MNKRISKKEWFDHLRRFLRDRGLFDKYMEKFYDFEDRKMSDFIKSTSPDDFIIEAFLWREAFWSEIDQDWHEQVDKIMEANHDSNTAE